MLTAALCSTSPGNNRVDLIATLTSTPLGNWYYICHVYTWMRTYTLPCPAAVLCFCFISLVFMATGVGYWRWDLRFAFGHLMIGIRSTGPVCIRFYFNLYFHDILYVLGDHIGIGCMKE